MTQEVEVNLTLEVDTSKSKADIRRYIYDLINIATLHDSVINRMMYRDILIKSIKEESELYKTE